MPQDGQVAETIVDFSASAERLWRRRDGVNSQRTRSRAGAARQVGHGAAVAVRAPESKAHRVSPRVFAGLVRVAEFALVSSLGFVIAYFYVADYFRQYAAALALAGFAAVTVFQALGLYNIAAFAAAHRQLPRLLAGWTVTVGLLLAACSSSRSRPTSRAPGWRCGI